MSKVKVFAREASGLVREMSITDIFFYGIFASSLIYFMYFFPMAQYYWPGTSIPIGFLIAFVPAVPFLIVYAAVGSAMPRSGGDYLFQSRLLHPAIGFAVPMAFFVIFWWACIAISGYIVAQLGLAPLFYLVGYSTGNSLILSIGDWLVTPLANFIIAEIVSLLSLLTIVGGMKLYVKIQRWILVPSILVTVAVVILMFATTSHSGFVDAFNLWGQRVMGDSNLYQTILTMGQEAGAISAFSWGMTLFFVMTPLCAFVYSMYSAQGLLGEIKKANNFKLLALAFTGAAAFLLIVNFGLPGWLFENVVGWDFIQSFAYAYYGGLAYFPTPSIGMFAALLSSNPIIWILSVIGFITIGYYYSTCVYLNNTRVLMAMGLDRALPEWFSRVNERFRAPINAAVFYFIGGTIWTYLFVYWGEFYFTTTVALVITALAGVAITCLGVALMPLRRPDIWKTAPAKKYGPTVPILAVIGFLIGAFYFYSMLTEPMLGGTDPVAQATSLILLTGCFIFFYLYRAYQKSKGINIDLAYKEIPPE